MIHLLLRSKQDLQSNFSVRDDRDGLSFRIAAPGALVHVKPVPLRAAGQFPPASGSLMPC
jgi:hypothetical protein